MPRLAALTTAVPEHVVTQAEARAACEKAYAGQDDLLRLLRIFANSGVLRRHFSFPVGYYLEERSFDERNADFIEKGTDLAERAARACLERAGVRPEQVDHVYAVTTTGLATPSLDALLVPRLGLRRDVRRFPLFGLGCAGGAGGLLRAAEAVRAQPRQRALVVSVELCGQVFSRQAATPVDVVGAALFGDGAAAALVTGDEAGSSGPRVLASQTVLFDGTRDLMGWDFTSDGMRLVLSEEVTELVRTRLRPAVDAFLGSAALTIRNITHWVLHPGGRKILEAYREAFEASDRTLEWTTRCLARFGNLSSASVLFILSDVLESGKAKAGDKALVVALGPGFAAEMTVLVW